MGGVKKDGPHFSPLPPSRKTTIEASSYYLAALAQLVEHLICNQENSLSPKKHIKIIFFPEQKHTGEQVFTCAFFVKSGRFGGNIILSPHTTRKGMINWQLLLII